ncbi:MAG: hypothetical protein AAGJ79_03225 [Verrucomicrobiota bacterium]
MFESLLVIGVAVFSFACRTYAHPLVRKLGGVGVLATTFLIAYFLSGRDPLWGVAGVLFWFFLPWIELITRVRQLRLPLEKKMHHRFPPNREIFPGLHELTRDVEDEGFEHVEDSGWEWENTNQFVRMFYNEEQKLEASIYLTEQQGIAFAYFSVSSESEDGRKLTTWNYPFAYTMKFAPDTRINRVINAGSFIDLLNSHDQFLIENAVFDEDLVKRDPEELQKDLESNMKKQVNHNLDQGLIRLSGDGTFRYSWRGLFYLWTQFIVQMVKYS